MKGLPEPGRFDMHCCVLKSWCQLQVQDWMESRRDDELPELVYSVWSWWTVPFHFCVKGVCKAQGSQCKASC